MQRRIEVLIVAMATLVWSLPVAAAQMSKYVGEETRPIKSLSQQDIAELERGGGWGLAKAAELNGVPGPTHLLELKNDIPLSQDQVNKLQALFDGMNKTARRQGLRLIALEAALEQQFSSGMISDDSLEKSLEAISEARKNLRFTHLSAHLKTPDILTADQIRRYNELRGYFKPDPCSHVPQGHNAAMWRKHNGCE